MKIWAYEACRLFRDKLAKEDDEQKFDSLLKGVLQADWNSGAFESIANSYYVTLGDSNSASGSVMPAFGRKLGYLSPSEWEPLGNLILNHIWFTYVLGISYIDFRMWQNLNIEFLILRNYVSLYIFLPDKTDKTEFFLNQEEICPQVF